MGLIECIMLLIMLILCVKVNVTDLGKGKVYNKTLFIFGIIGIVMDLIYYSAFNLSMFFPFLINLVVMIFANLILFCSHTFAGGDCKLLIVLTLLYPAKYYISYRGSLITVIFFIGFAVFYGYLYLLGSSLWSLINRKNKMTLTYIKDYLLIFIKSFINALIYISAITLIILLMHTHGINIPIWILRIICIAASWGVGKYSILRKKSIVGAIVLFDLVMAINLKTIPFSIHPENYLLVILLLVFQMIIKTSLYQEIDISSLNRGMILSTGSSILMQNSRVRGLPQISSEDLRNRLSDTEVESIKKWGKGNRIETVYIVKKIPFAVFITLGVLNYFVFWGILSWI